MDFDVPQDIQDYLAELDRFIEAEIKPLEAAGRQHPLLRPPARARAHRLGQRRPAAQGVGGAAGARRARRADAAGHLRYAWPVEWGGKGGTNLAMAIIREHLAAKGLGLHNDLQTEHSIVGNNPFIIMFKEFATNAQYDRYRRAAAERRAAAPASASPSPTTAPTPPTWRPARVREETRRRRPAGGSTARRCGPPACTWPTTSCAFARTSGEGRRRRRHHRSSWCRPSDPGVKIEEYLWTFNMPTDHPRVSIKDVWVPDDAIWGAEGQGLRLGQSFVHQNRIRQAAVVAGRGGLLRRGEREVRPGPQAVRPAAVRQPGDPVAAGGAAHPVRDAAPADPQDRLGDGPHAAQGGGAADLRQGLHVQLLGQPAGLRGGRPGDAGARRHRLFAPQAVRAHLPPPPPLPHHRGLGRDPDAQGGARSCSATWGRAARRCAAVTWDDVDYRLHPAG